MEEKTLNIPNIGLGTWLISNDKVGNVVKDAIDLGYRHIDTAQAYGNEKGIGKALKEISIKREDLFITTKVKAEYKSYSKAKKSIDKSLKDLGVDYLDLVLIHSPEPWLVFRKTKRNWDKKNLEVWKALEDSYKEGKVKHIGVSNFRIKDLENILDNCEIKPIVNQVLAHIGKTPFELIKYCHDKNIIVEAYSPIAHGEADRINEVNEIAKKYNKSFAQICLRYCLQLGMIVLPKASSKEHLEANLDLNFEISEEDMEILKNAKLNTYGKSNIFPCFSQADKNDL